MLAREPYSDSNQLQDQERESTRSSMTLPPSLSRDNTWTQPAAPNSSYSGQVSPLSGLVSGSTNHARISYSTASSCEGSWASTATDNDEAERDVNWDEWEQRSDSAPIIPKSEPTDEDDICMSEFKSTPIVSNETSTAPSCQKRGRGRPRKNPLLVPANGAKVTKGRSKTGCITCRRRKKKCDEAKPGCKYPATCTAIFDFVTDQMFRYELREELCIV